MKTESLPLSHLKRHAQNARHKGEYRKADLADLIASIREHGLLQPLVVKRNGAGYEILAGHRRHAALKALKAKDAPCIVLDPEDDKAALAVLLTENAQRRRRKVRGAMRLWAGCS